MLTLCVSPELSQWLIRTLGLVVALTVFTTANAAESQPAEGTLFDVEVLKARGVDPRVSELFRNSPRFLPGETTVALTVNGNARGKVKVLFDQDATLCVDKSFLKAAGLSTPPELSDKAPCFDLKTAWPQTEWHMDPGDSRVDLVVPSAAVSAPGALDQNWNHGGFAGMFNYDASYLDSAGAGAGVNFMQVNTEAGFNLNDWIVRSRQSYSRLDGTGTLRFQAAYAQRTFAERKEVLQAGQVSLSNSMFGTGQVMGFQVFPEAALQNNSGGAGLVEGFADSQSVVEVRQSGALVYTTTVPTGPFRLQGFALLNTRSDLNVTVIGSNGDRRQFIVPASALLLSGPAVAPGLSYGVGRLDQQGSSESPVIGTVANGWLLNPATTLSAGLLGSSLYRAQALGLNSQLLSRTALSAQVTLAQDQKHGANGVSGLVSLNHNLTDRIGVSLNASQQTSDYRELSDAVQSDDASSLSRSQRQIGGAISWFQDTLGNMSLSVSRSIDSEGASTRYLRGGWSKAFGSVYMGASLEYDTGNQNNGFDSQNGSSQKRFYLTVSIPLGQGRNLNSYFNNSSNGNRIGTRFSDRTNRDFGWGLASERDFGGRRTSATGSLDLVTPVSQLSGSISSDNNHYTSWSANASGGGVVHDKGLTFSPNRIGDTFGIAKVGEESGVRMDTPGGPAWTDRRGYAVLPSLTGYRQSTIQVDTRTLAKNVDISNAWQDAEAARGSVNYVNFDVVRTRRVLVAVTDNKNQPLPYGASIFDDGDHFVTVVGEQGSVFIPDVTAAGKFVVRQSGSTLCSFALALPHKADMSGFYETASAVCR